MGAGKTTLLEELAAVAKARGRRLARFDFDEEVEGCERPDCVFVDHPASPRSLEAVREKYRSSHTRFS